MTPPLARTALRAGGGPPRSGSGAALDTVHRTEFTRRQHANETLHTTQGRSFSRPGSIPRGALERLGDGRDLIGPDPGTGERRHAADRREGFRRGLQYHQVERLLAVTPRAPDDQQRRPDALELLPGNVGARVALHALDGALNLRRLHRHGRAKPAGRVTLDAVPGQDLVH